jgi:hypothetical protein
MKQHLLPYVLFVSLILFPGCESLAPTAGPQPTAQRPVNRDPKRWWDPALGERDGLRGYRVAVEVSDPGSKIEVNNEFVGTITNTTGEIILWGNDNGTFRGDRLTTIKANPVKGGQFVQAKTFDERRDPIPHSLFFNLALQPASTSSKPGTEVNIINQPSK